MYRAPNQCSPVTLGVLNYFGRGIYMVGEGILAMSALNSGRTLINEAVMQVLVRR